MRAAFSRSGVGTTLAVVALALAVYVCSSFVVMQLTGDAVAGSAAGSAASLVSALVYRRWRHGSWAARRPDDLPSPAFWGWAAAAVAASFLAGQTLAVWVYGAFGSPGYDAVVSSEQASPAWLLLVTTLVLAPVGEEALVRGVVFARMREHWPLWASAVASAGCFAALHANIVQAVAVFPLAVVLALVFGRDGRLWPVVAMHAGFNLASLVVPAAAVSALASSPVGAASAVVLWTAVVVGLDGSEWQT